MLGSGELTVLTTTPPGNSLCPASLVVRINLVTSKFLAHIKLIFMHLMGYHMTSFTLNILDMMKNTDF